MAITTLDQALAGFQPPIGFHKAVTNTLVAGRPVSLFQFGGVPGPGTPNATLNGANYSSTSAVPAGILYHADPGSGNAYLGRFVGMGTIAGMLLLCDRLWDDQLAINVTTLQSPTQPTLPARDNTGTTNGAGVVLGLEVVAATSSTAATVTVTYTNSAGTASHTGSFVDVPTAAANAQGNFYRIGLQAGDQGVRLVTGVQFGTAWTSGTISLVAYRVLAALEISNAWLPAAIDALTSGFPQLYNGTCPFMIFVPSTTTATNISGMYAETQG